MSIPAFLEKGRVYDLLGGGEYICRDLPGYDEAVLERVSDGYTLTAVDVRQVGDGKIYWAYSYGGHWPRGAWAKHAVAPLLPSADTDAVIKDAKQMTRCQDFAILPRGPFSSRGELLRAAELYIKEDRSRKMTQRKYLSKLGLAGHYELGLVLSEMLVNGKIAFCDSVPVDQVDATEPIQEISCLES